MRRIVSVITIISGLCSLYGGPYEEQMSQADKLFAARKYKEAAAAFDDASLETENAVKRIEARYRSWDCLRKSSAANTISAAESLLYDEAALSNDRKVELISHIALKGNKESRKRTLEFGLGLKGLSEKQRSKILLLAMKSGGTWQSEAYVNEVLAMKTPDPVAKANALGHRANVYLWVKRDPATALQYIGQALAIKELVGEDRQFYLLVQARCNVALKKFYPAEKSYLAAIKIAKQRDFQDAAYKELVRIYAVSRQRMKIEPLLKRASEDKCLNNRQRLVFSNLLTQIDKARKQ
jgi:hypothetical protein